MRLAVLNFLQDTIQKIVYDNITGTNERIDDFTQRVSNLIFGSVAFLGAYGIWKRKGWAIAASIALALIIGFLNTPNQCLEDNSADYCGYDAKAEEKTWNEHLSSGIIIALAFFSGMILTTIVITGLYIARIYEQTQGRPRYIIKNILEKK